MECDPEWKKILDRYDMHNSISPKGYEFFANIDNDSELHTLYTPSYYKTIRKAARDCRKPIGLAVRKVTYHSDKFVNEPSLHIIKSDRERIIAVCNFVYKKMEPLLDEYREQTGRWIFAPPLKNVLPIVRKAVFEAARLGIF